MHNLKKKIKQPPKQRGWQRGSYQKLKYHCPLNKHSGSLATREMKIKTKLRSYIIPIRISVTMKTSDRYWIECGQMGTLKDYWCECKLVYPVWKLNRSL